MRLSTVFKVLGVFLVLSIGAFSAALYKIDFNHYKSEIGDFVHALTDRRLKIKGAFKLTFGLNPSVAVDRVTFSNAKWGSRRDMVRIKSLRAELELLPLLYGEVRIKRVVLLGADILLETRSDGLGNWVLQPSAKKTDGLPIVPTFDRVLIKNSKLVWRDRRTGSKSVVRINRIKTSASSAAAPLNFNLRGSFNGEALRLTGIINSLASLTANKPTAVQLKLKAGGAWLKMKGQIKEPMSGANLKVAISGAGKNLATLSGLLGTALPSLGPYKLSANLVNEKSRWRLRGLKLKVGKSDLNGYVSINPNKNPVAIYAKLTSNFFRMSDFEEKTVPAKSGRSKKMKRRTPARKKKDTSGRFFSSDRFSFSGLEGATAKIRLRANRVQFEDYIFDKAVLTIKAWKGRLILSPARAKFEGGDLKLVLDMAAVKRGVRVKFKANVKNMNLARLAKRMGQPGLATGKIYADTSLSGTGRSMRSLMAGLDGSFIAMMKGGRINNRKFTNLSGDTLAAILPWSTGDKGIDVKCLVGQYAIKKGRLTSNVTLLDTDRLLVKGEGGANLASEIIDFTITPKAKEASIVNLLVPIRIDGKLADPEVYADPAGVAKNALGFATGGILANGLVSEIIGSIVSGLSGQKEANPCLVAITEIKKSTQRGKTKAGAKGSKAKSKEAENMFNSIGEGLKSLFSR